MRPTSETGRSQAITGAIKGVLTSLDPSVVTGMSPGLKSTILDIGQTVQNLPEAAIWAS